MTARLIRPIRISMHQETNLAAKWHEAVGDEFQIKNKKSEAWPRTSGIEVFGMLSVAIGGRLATSHYGTWW